MQKRSSTVFRLIGIAVLAVVVIAIVFSSYAIINPGHRGVVVMLGRVEQAILSEGFHLILPPVIRQAVQVDIRTKKLEVEADAASSDLQVMKVNGVLNYHLDPQNVNKLYQQVGLDYESIIIQPAMQEAIKASTAQFRVEQILVERAVIKDLISQNLTKRLAQNYIVVDQFSLANVAFSDEFNKAIERKQVAEQAALQKQYELQAAQKDVEIAVARAEGEKKAAVINAEGRAEARKVEAAAEAEALRLIAEQLRGNPDLIKYQWAIKLSPTISTVLLPSDQNIILDSGALLQGQGGSNK
jgi:regulator of protease activity HflC (stomatin/prohibitin superfamily)